MNDFDFILASGSPRRRDLLEKAGYKFFIEVSGVDESLYQNYKPAEHAQELALAKAKDVAEKFPDHLVLGADTIAVCQGMIIGKPSDAKDAEKITRLLFSRCHEVITGVAFVKLNEGVEIVKADTTTVYPKMMTEREIQNHIAGKSWQGKAGAYAIQETGEEMVERLDGSLTNVMGLPMELVTEVLDNLI